MCQTHIVHGIYNIIYFNRQELWKMKATVHTNKYTHNTYITQYTVIKRRHDYGLGLYILVQEETIKDFVWALALKSGRIKWWPRFFKLSIDLAGGDVDYMLWFYDVREYIVLTSRSTNLRCFTQPDLMVSSDFPVSIACDTGPIFEKNTTILWS